MEDYINNFKNYEKTIVYDFKLGDGGIGDYLKFFMIILTECMNSSSKVKLYHKINDLEIEKYIKLKYDFMNIDSDKISKLTNVSIKTPKDYYYKDSYNGTICLNEVFYFEIAHWQTGSNTTITSLTSCFETSSRNKARRAPSGRFTLPVQM